MLQCLCWHHTHAQPLARLHTRTNICLGLKDAGGEDHKMAFIRGSCLCELWRNLAFVLSQDLILLIEITLIKAFSSCFFKHFPPLYRSLLKKKMCSLSCRYCVKLLSHVTPVSQMKMLRHSSLLCPGHPPSTWKQKIPAQGSLLPEPETFQVMTNCCQLSTCWLSHLH